jgi:hypothetical protein
MESERSKTPIEPDHQDTLGFSQSCLNTGELRFVQRERLLDENVLTRAKRLLGVLGMRVVASRDHNGVKIIVLKQRVCVRRGDTRTKASGRRTRRHTGASDYCGDVCTVPKRGHQHAPRECPRAYDANSQPVVRRQAAKRGSFRKRETP